MSLIDREKLRYRKVATVEAQQATEGGTIPTLEGDHTYEAGDYICGPGAEGEFWPVKRSIFEATYVLAAPAAEPVPLTLDAHDLADTFCFLRRSEHPEDCHCPASMFEAEQVCAALQARALARPEPSAQEDRSARDPESPAP